MSATNAPVNELEAATAVDNLTKSEASSAEFEAANAMPAYVRVRIHQWNNDL